MDKPKRKRRLAQSVREQSWAPGGAGAGAVPGIPAYQAEHDPHCALALSKRFNHTVEQWARAQRDAPPAARPIDPALAARARACASLPALLCCALSTLP